MPDVIAKRLSNGHDYNLAKVGSSGFSLPGDDHLEAKDLGRGNIVYSGAGESSFHFDIAPEATDNIILVEPGSGCTGRILIWGSRNLAIIRGSNQGRQPINLHMFANDGVFFLGKDVTSNTATFEISGDHRSILVGEDCMFSAFIDVGTDDRHAIIDFETGAHINPPESVLIGPHSWIGLHATILKGVTIGFGGIVAARSVVTKSVPEMTIVGGSPARILREGAVWIRDRSPNQVALEGVLQQRAAYQAVNTDGRDCRSPS